MKYLPILLLLLASCHTSQVPAPLPKPDTPTKYFIPVQTVMAAEQHFASVTTDNAGTGTWLTTSNPTQDKIDAFPRGSLTGIRLRQGSNDVNPAAGVYSFTQLDAAVNLAVKNRLMVGFQTWRNDIKNIPSFWMNTVDKVITDDNNLNQYGYYLDPQYQVFCDSVTSKTAAHLKGYTNDQRKTLLFWLGSFGVTGDYGDYKGTPKDSRYVIPDVTWDAYVDKNIATQQRLSPIPIAMNPSNAGIKWDHLLSLGVRFLKFGDYGHGYGIDGSGTSARRIQSVPGLYTFSESEGIQRDTSWHAGDWWAINLEAITAGVKMLSVSGIDNSTVIGSLFFNKHASGNTAFFAANGAIDYADTLLSSLPVIDPLRLVQYQKQVQRVNADATMGNAAKQDKLASLLSEYKNPARVADIQARYRAQGYDFNAASQYYNDGGTDIIRGGYRRNMELLNPQDVAFIPRAEIGDPAYWRWVMRPKPYGSMYFSLNIPQKDTTTISVTYFDVPGRWSMNLVYWNGNSRYITPFLRSTATGKWVTQEFKIACDVRKEVGINCTGSPLLKVFEAE